MTELQKQRLQWVDVLRGIAILFMIPANLSTLWEASHPMWFRLMGSFAAPTFILLIIHLFVHLNLFTIMKNYCTIQDL